MADRKKFKSSDDDVRTDVQPKKAVKAATDMTDIKARTVPFGAPDDDDGDMQTFAVAKETAKITFGVFFTLFRKLLTYTLNIVLTLMLILVITGASVVLTFAVYIKTYVDTTYDGLDNLRFDSSLSTSLYYLNSDGEEVELEEDRLYGGENRLWASYGEMPTQLIDAYIAVEDQRFMTHNGIDAKRTLSALFNFFIPTSANYGGGSTITQQLIKNVSGDDSVTIQRKVQEIFRAIDVEKKFSKQQILEMYLNTIYLSQRCYGVNSAAQKYFGKELSDLTLSECAAIAAIGKSPARYDPIANPKNNLQRRNLVLKLMLEQGKISEDEFNEAYDAPLILADDDEEETDGVTVHSYYIDAVIDDVIEALQEKYGCDYMTASRMLYSGGLNIVTCMDPTLQKIAEDVYTSDENFEKVTGIKGQSAMCLIEQKTGNIVALVGGRGEKRTARGLNRATQSKRQCGSSIKPLSVYSLAIDKGLLTYGSPMDDCPPIYYEDTGVYYPQNASFINMGMISLNYAVHRSLNTVATRTYMMLGPDVIFDHLTKNLGITTLIESITYENGQTFSDKALSPLALGGMTQGVTVREMCQAYSSLANGGVFNKSRTFSEVRDSQGNIIIDNKTESHVAFKESTAYIMTEILQGVINTGHGTSRYDITFWRDFPNLKVVGKTGSTNDNKDVYFAGYTPDYTLAVWYGYDTAKTIVAGGNCAALLWNQVFKRVYEYFEENDIPYTEQFEVPVDVVTNVTYCTVSGKLPTDACRADLGVMNGERAVIATDGVFTRDTVPTEYCDCHIMVDYDTSTKAVCLEGCDCDRSDIIQVGLRKVSRTLYKNLPINDAQYLWYDVDMSTYTPPASKDVSYWRYCLPEGTYMGYSVLESPANRICLEHWHKKPNNSNPDDTSGDTSGGT